MLAPNEPKSALILEIERRALEIAAAIDDRTGEYYFEALPDVIPRWHIVTVQPGNEGHTYEHLADRRCGVFCPKFGPDAVLEVPIYHHETGRLLKYEKVALGNKLIFPGRLFVFIWDIEHHWRRLRNCPGVSKIMINGNEQPVTIADTDINKIQGLQYSLNPMPKAKRKRYKAANVEPMTISARSFWSVDDAQRVATLDGVLNAH